MTDEIKPFLDRLAETFPDRAAPLPELLAAAHAGRRRRTRTTLAAAAASVALVLGGGVVVQQLMRGDNGTPAADKVAEPPQPSPPAENPLGESAAVAVRIVEKYIEENPDWDVESAWARAARGTVAQPNVGECTSGELLKISVFGTFPIPTSGYAPDPDNPSPTTDPDPLADIVTEVLLTADAATEEVCLLGVGKGTRAPDPRATQVYPAGASSSSPIVLPEGRQVPTDLDCPSANRGIMAAPYSDNSSGGARTPEEAVERFLAAPFGARFGPDYVMDENKTNAWLLREDGSAEAKVGIGLFPGGYFFNGMESCG